MMKGQTPHDIPGMVDPNWNIGIIASSYHKEHIDSLVEGARTLLVSSGIPDANIRIFHAPGSFEIPLIGAAVAEKGNVDALIGFGIIVEGETQHARLLAESVTYGMMDVQLTYAMPFAFEVLYVDDIAQAIERTRGDHNKGGEAARAVLHSLAELQRIKK